VLGVFKAFVIILGAIEVNADILGALKVNVVILGALKVNAVILVLGFVKLSVVKQCCVFYCYAECL
jgi:hypothetical protein